MDYRTAKVYNGSQWFPGRTMARASVTFMSRSEADDPFAETEVITIVFTNPDAHFGWAAPYIYTLEV